MKNIEKYQSLLASGEVDALLLTSEYNRLYAAQYSIAEGVAVVTKDGAYYFTDSRYIEAAENNLPGFTVRMTHPGSSDIERINEVIGEHTIKKLGFEESNMTYAMFLEFQHALHAVLVPMQKKIDAFRASKEPWELELMRKAQEITDLTFAQLQKVICAGMTEKDLRAELIYRLYKNGANGLSFDPIVVSGPNTSMPHGVPSDRGLQGKMREKFDVALRTLDGREREIADGKTERLCKGDEVLKHLFRGPQRRGRRPFCRPCPCPLQTAA